MGLSRLPPLSKVGLFGGSKTAEFSSSTLMRFDVFRLFLAYDRAFGRLGMMFGEYLAPPC